MKQLLLSSVIAACLAIPAAAQFDTATILGTVKDKSGGVVPGAKVTLTNIGTGISSTKEADDGGGFEFLQVRIGHYKLVAEKAGFALAVVEDFEATVGARQRIDLELRVGSVSETVNVSESVSLVETDTSQRGQVIKQEAISELPLNGRQYSSLVLLTTGVRPSPISTGGFVTREGSVNVNGLRSTVNNFLLDGVDNNAYGTSNQGFANQVMQPTPDAVAEFQVVTNNMSAEYGRTGGATVNVAYKSGTNRLKGSLWEFNRNRSMNAFDYYRPRDGKKPPFNRNQFGATLGGPIVKNRTFFFVDYEGTRWVAKNVVFVNLPTANDRNAVFSVPVKDPIRGTIYPANTPLPRNVLLPFAVKVLNDLPAAFDNATRSSNFYGPRGFKDFGDKFNAKFDHQFSTRVSAFLRVGQRKDNILEEPGIPGPSGGDSNGRTRIMNQALASGVTMTATPRDLIEFRFGVNRTNAGKNPIGLGGPSMLAAYGISGLPSDPRVSGGLNSQLFSGISNIGRQATNPQWQYPTMWNPKVNYSRIIFKHSLKAGYEYQRIHTEVQDVNPLYGRDSYAGGFSKPTPTAPGDAGTFSIADFFFGARDTYALTTLFIAQYRQQMSFLYLQDDWKVSPKLTLNLGIRYEYASPQWEKENRLSNFDPVGLTMVAATNGSIGNRARIDPDRNNWAPRVGAAYSWDSKTVIRSGFGVNFIHFNRAGGGNLLAINGPQVVNALVSQNPTQSTFRTTDQGYPAGFTDSVNFNPLRANVTYMPQNYRSAYVASWFFGVQREIAKNTIVDIAYVGNRSNKLLLFADYNQAAPNTNGSTIALQSRRPIATFSDITYAHNGGWSNYQSLQARFERRFQGGLFFLNSFTWGKAMDNGAGALEGINGAGSSMQDFRNRAGDKGPSAYDQTLTNTTSVLYNLPYGKGRKWGANGNAVIDAVIGGWQVGGISNAYSGGRINLVHQLAGNFSVSGIQQDWRGRPWFRPNISGDPILAADLRLNEQYLNPSNVSLPTATGPNGNNPFGNVGRNIARMPAFYQMDFSLMKDFHLPREGMGLQFRSEFFNVFNVTNYRTVDSNRSSASYGRFNGAYEKRQVQLGLRFTF
ncbi:MAG: TonB-dependent receptor [Acidobacteria bacterium]|nr:TonB-dependent receptor [Acidobacteriota bacterium]